MPSSFPPWDRPGFLLALDRPHRRPAPLSLPAFCGDDSEFRCASQRASVGIELDVEVERGERMVLGRIEMSAAQLQRGGAVQLKGGPKRQPSWRATLAPHVVHLGRDRTEIPPAQKAEGSDRARRQRPLPVSRRGGSTGNGREGDEKRVSLGVDLDTALGGESLSQQPAMRSQRLAVLLRPYPLQQTGWNLRYP